MDTIGQNELWSFFDSRSESREAKCSEIRKGCGHPVSTFLDLATKVAELQFRNREHVLLFRGQNSDYLNHAKNSTLKPSLFRPVSGPEKIPTQARLVRRFQKLRRTEKELVRLYPNESYRVLDQLKRHRILRWALLQHYEVCKTPLLDVTHSLRIAASFASLGAKENAFIFVLGVPNLSGAVTASAESGLQIVRLSSVCPPKAVRPHIQEGYLLGEYPDLGDFAQKENYEPHEIDFGRRLIGKFIFDPKTFWRSDTFPLVTKAALYPDDSDPMIELMETIKRAINSTKD